MGLGNLPVTSTRNALRYANQKSAVSLMTGILAGAAIGAAVGLLLAPQSGAETRQLLKEKGGECACVIKEKAAKVTETVKAKVDDIKAKNHCCSDTCDCEEESAEEEVGV